MEHTTITTTASPLRANDVKHKNEDKRKTSKHLSLNSLFLQSLGDEDSSLLVTMLLTMLLSLYYCFIRRQEIVKVNEQGRGEIARYF